MNNNNSNLNLSIITSRQDTPELEIDYTDKDSISIPNTNIEENEILSDIISLTSIIEEKTENIELSNSIDSVKKTENDKIQISVMVSKKKLYEDVLEEQRKYTEELLIKDKVL